MKYYRHHTTIFFLSVAFCVSVSAQNKITVSASADKNKILIGEQIQLSLKANFPTKEPVRFFSPDTIPHFEILHRNKIDTIDNNGAIELEQTLVLTSFDSGRFIIPALPLDVNGDIYTDSIPVEVSFSPFDTAQAYHDIKDIIDEEDMPAKNKYPWYYFIFPAVVILGLIIYFATRKKKPVPAVQKSKEDAYITAQKNLQALQNEKEVKIFYTKLVDTFREYIASRKNIESQKQTTDDLVIQLRSLQLSQTDYNALAQALRTSDFVKFAKYQASSADQQESFSIIKNIIDQVEQQTKMTNKQP